MELAKDPLDNLDAAILGMFAAVKICNRKGIDPHQLCELLVKHVRESPADERTTESSNVDD